MTLQKWITTSTFILTTTWFSPSAAMSFTITITGILVWGIDDCIPDIWNDRWWAWIPVSYTLIEHFHLLAGTTDPDATNIGIDTVNGVLSNVGFQP